MNFKYKISKSLLKISQFLKPSKDGTLLDLISFFLILLIGSNHPRRIKNIYKINNDIILNEYEKIKNTNLICQRNKYKTVNLFVGDSHSEFFGRNFVNTDNNKFFLTFHTGPSTLAEFGSSPKMINRICKITNFLYFYGLRRDKNINLIFCLGEIDVRIFFYQKLKIEKSFNNISDYNKYLSKNFFKNFRNLKKKLAQKKIGNVNFYFNDIVPPSNKKYYLPKNPKALHEIVSFNNFPNLGTIKNRIAYTKNLTQNMKTVLKNKKIKFLNLSKENNLPYLSKKNSIDGHHITDFKLIQEIHKQIF